MNDDSGDNKPAQSRVASDESGPELKVDVRTLLKGRRSVTLVLDDQDYVLRLTSNNKLILTK